MATQSYKSLGTYLRVCPLFYELMLLCLSDTNDADHKWKRYDLPELTNDLNEFNTFLFPYKEKKKLVYSK